MKKRRASCRKYMWLFLITGVVLAGLYAYQSAENDRMITVETVVIKRQDVKETTVCAGTVSASGGVEVYAPIPCVAGTAVVAVGDAVKKGDVLIEIDRDATVSQAVSVGLIGTDMGNMVSTMLSSSIVAPADGIVSVLNVERGALMSTSSPCVVLTAADATGIEIAVTVRENALKKVKVGQAVTVSGVAFEKKGYNGTLTYLSPTARTRVNGTVTETVVDAVVTISEEETDESLLVGLSAKASITVDIKPAVLLLPYECLMQDDNGRTVVYTIDGGVATRRVIKIGKESASGVEVLEGLTEGATVVKDPERLTGNTVRVRAEDS